MPVSRSGMKAPYDALRFLMQIDQEDGERKLVPEQAQPVRGASRFSTRQCRAARPALLDGGGRVRRLWLPSTREGRQRTVR